MTAPHTHFDKGMTVHITTRAGGYITGKFVERRGNYVQLEGRKVLVRHIRAMSRRRLVPLRGSPCA